MSEIKLENQDSILEYIKDSILKRMYRRLNTLEFNEVMKLLGVESLYICGNSCNDATPNDYDIYLTPRNGVGKFNEIFLKREEFGPDLKCISNSMNALTFKWKDRYIVQLCSYHKPSLRDMINSFDFSYCRVGVEVFLLNGKDCLLSKVEVTPEYIEYLVTGVTEFVNSEYPLSSLIRVIKTNEKGLFNGRSYIKSIIKILNTIVSRGFVDYNDFKDQLDAVDLGLLDEEIRDSKQDFFTLYKLLTKNTEDLTND